MNTELSKQGGFTLIEALIALLIFTIGILATISMQITALQGNSIARHNTDAAAIAASVVEGIRGLPFDHPDLAPTPAGECRQQPNDGHHSVCYTVEENIIIADTKLIQVVVDWTDGATPRSVTIGYLLHDTI